MEAAPSADAFWLQFNSEITVLQDSLIGVKASSDLVALKDKLTELQTYATNSGLVLANYDVRRAQEVLDTSSKYIKEKEEQIQPRKKFKFKSKHLVLKGLTSVTGITDNTSMDKENVKSQTKEKIIDPTLYVVESKEAGERIVLTAETIGEVNGVMRALHIKNCKGTIIFARCVLGAVRIEHCEDCRIFLGPCSTSVYLDSVMRGCVFITSHQLRIHKCVGPHLYVKVNGHPIIEDCKEMCFAPYHVTYAGLRRDLRLAKLEDAKCWDNVVDFRWHRTTHSPNWRILDVQERTVYEAVKDDEGETVWGVAPEVQGGLPAPPPAVRRVAAAPLTQAPPTDNGNGDNEESDDEM